MRVLLSTTPAAGHLQPMLPLARALHRAGHEVAVAVAPGMCPRVATEGLLALESGRDIESWWPALEERNPERPWERLLPEEILLWFLPHLFVEVGARAMVDDLAAHVDRWRPDLVVHESYEFAAPVVAAAGGIPSVHHTLSPLPDAAVIDACAGAAAPMWRARGLLPAALAGLGRGPTLDICPPSLRNVHGPALDSRPLRPPGAAPSTEPAPEWLDRLAERPVVHLTLGTSVTNANQALLATAVEGLRELPLSLVVTVGPDNDPAGLGPQPDSVRVERYVPHDLLLPRCVAVVTHGGAGTMLGALGCGLPLLTIPQGADQYLNAEICARRGVGRTLLTEQVTPTAVREEVGRLLDEPGYRAAAGEVAAEITAMPAPDDVVPALESLAAG
ncbi:MAG TPA: glycosyltransferase [Candidatus Dormibacteraeota bacterium]